jgi:hypothetical protein
VSLRVLIKPTGTLCCAFLAEATGANLTGTTNPVPVTSGATSVNAEIDS